MEILNLDRHSYHPGATVGEIRFNDRVFHTIERPWLNNQPFVSCIPEGFYLCRPYSSAKYPDVYEIVGVPGRDKILIHVANYAKDVQGCIGLGLGISTDRLMVTSSRDALSAFKNLIGSESFYLNIKQKLQGATNV